MSEGCGILCIYTIKFIAAIVFLILNLVWLFPVMNNSKKDEPQIENLTCYLPNQNNLRYLILTELDCDFYLYEISNKGAYKTFDLKMDNIHKYSTGLLSIFFIQAGLLVLFIVGLIISIITEFDAFAFFIILYFLLDILCSILNLIFFIILSVNYYKCKFNNFQDFGGCYFFDKEKFMEDYDNVFKVKNNFKKVFIINIISLSLSFLGNVCSLLCRKKK